MLSKLIMMLTEPVCQHCPGSDPSRWEWSIAADSSGIAFISIRCLVCGERMIVPSREMHAFIRIEKDPAIRPVEEEIARPPVAPQVQGIQHSRVFTKFDERLLKKWGISTEDIVFKS